MEYLSGARTVISMAIVVCGLCVTLGIDHYRLTLLENQLRAVSPLDQTLQTLKTISDRLDTLDRLGSRGLAATNDRLNAVSDHVIQSEARLTENDKQRNQIVLDLKAIEIRQIEVFRRLDHLENLLLGHPSGSPHLPP